ALVSAGVCVRVFSVLAVIWATSSNYSQGSFSSVGFSMVSAPQLSFPSDVPLKDCLSPTAFPDILGRRSSLSSPPQPSSATPFMLPSLTPISSKISRLRSSSCSLASPPTFSGANAPPPDSYLGNLLFLTRENL